VLGLIEVKAGDAGSIQYWRTSKEASSGQVDIERGKPAIFSPGRGAKESTMREKIATPNPLEKGGRAFLI